jgi:hypothetical protein
MRNMFTFSLLIINVVMAVYTAATYNNNHAVLIDYILPILLYFAVIILQGIENKE